LKENQIIHQDRIKLSQELWNIDNQLKIKKLNYDVLFYNQIIYFIHFYLLKKWLAIRIELNYILLQFLRNK
jgi:hypothetical protein